MNLSYPATASDYQALARARLPRFLADYVDGGATDEQTLAANVADWAHIHLRQRVLVNVDNIDTSTTLAGQPCRLPIVLAPVGLAGMMARRGEVQAVRAANAAGVPFTLSTVGICPLDEIRGKTGRVRYVVTIDEQRADIPASLADTVIGSETAREIGLMRSTP